MARGPMRRAQRRMAQARDRHSRIGMGEAAWKGALAGLAGGAAMLGARELEARGLFDEEDEDEVPPPPGPRIARRAARARGRELTDRQAAISGIALQLAAAATVGAVYGVIRTRVPLPGGADGALLGALVYVGSRWGLLPATGLFESPADQSLQQALVPAGTHAVFGVATARAFEMLRER